MTIAFEHHRSMKCPNCGETILKRPNCYAERAAKDLGRKCTMIEIEERYCEIAARRCAQEVLNFEVEG